MNKQADGFPSLRVSAALPQAAQKTSSTGTELQQSRGSKTASARPVRAKLAVTQNQETSSDFNLKPALPHQIHTHNNHFSSDLSPTRERKFIFFGCKKATDCTHFYTHTHTQISSMLTFTSYKNQIQPNFTPWTLNVHDPL